VLPVGRQQDKIAGLPDAPVGRGQIERLVGLPGYGNDRCRAHEPVEGHGLDGCPAGHKMARDIEVGAGMAAEGHLCQLESVRFVGPGTADLARGITGVDRHLVVQGPGQIVEHGYHLLD